MAMGYSNRAEGHAASLRQQAAWIREALDPLTPREMRVDLGDIDVDELEDAATFIDIAMGNHNTLVETKRGIEARLKIALAALQEIYDVSRPEVIAPAATLSFIHNLAGLAFEDATTRKPPPDFSAADPGEGLSLNQYLRSHLKPASRGE